MRRQTRRAGYLLLPLALAIIAGSSLLRRQRRPASRTRPAPPCSTATCRFGAPRGADPDAEFVEKAAYRAWHTPRLKISRWVAYRAEGEDTADIERHQGDFFAEPGLAIGRRAEAADYRGIYRRDGSGFDRGHLAPDATIKRFGPEAQRETYSLANITPQYSATNRRVWADLEAAVRSWSSRDRPVWVVTGPVFLPERETLRIGSGRVAVPHAYFAVLDRDTGPEVLGFLVPNSPEVPWQPTLSRYLVAVDSLERLTGLDFLTDLPDSIESRLEARSPRQVWHLPR